MKDHRDSLTGFYSQEYFYETGEILRKNSVRDNLSFVVGIIDIVNAENAIAEASHLISCAFRTSDILTRFNNGKIGIIAVNVADEDIKDVFHKLIYECHAKALHLADMPVHVGICATLYDSFDDMVNIAFKALEKAQNQISSSIVIDFEGLE